MRLQTSAGRHLTSFRRISIGVPCSSDIVVAMGSAVYGTPHITSNCTPCTFRHITSATCQGSGTQSSAAAASKLSHPLIRYPCPHVLHTSLASNAHLVEDVWVRHDEAQVDVDRRHQAALQLELAKLDSLSRKGGAAVTSFAAEMSMLQRRAPLT